MDTGRDFLEIREVESGVLHYLIAPEYMDVPAGAVSLSFPVQHERRPDEQCFQARYVNVAGEAGELSEVVCPPRER